jgi:hypothetical protein
MPPSGYRLLLPFRLPFCQALSVLAHWSRLTVVAASDERRRDQPEADEHRRDDEAHPDPVASRHDRLPDDCRGRGLQAGVGHVVE